MIIACFFISVKFEARIGISELIARSLIPHLAGVVPPDLTNFNALRLFRPLSLDITTQTPFPKKFRWTLNGKTMQLKTEPTNDRVYITINGDLRIRFGMLTDEGEYQVFMSNDFGTMFSRKVGLKFSG